MNATQRSPRRLFLHISALNDEEYGAYTSAMRDILDADDGGAVSEEYLENVTLGLKEVRVWIRGRYRHFDKVDQILRLFCPLLNSNDTLSGGQFFAALRLITHVLNGEGLSESLVFVQARPESHEPTGAFPTQTSTRSAAPNRSLSPPLINPFHRPLDASTSPGSAGSIPRSTRSEAFPSSETSEPRSQDARQSSERTQYNPFLQRSKSVSAPSHSHSQSLSSTRIPPLPPRKPSAYVLGPAPPAPFAPSPPKPPFSALHPSPPERTIPLSKQNGKLIGVIPPTSNSTSILMKQSLIASKAGLSLKKAQADLEKERVLEVIQSSSRSRPDNVYAGSQSTPAMPTHPHIPPRRAAPSPPLTATGSINSLEQVASATLRKYPLSASSRATSSQGGRTSRSNSPSRGMQEHFAPPLHPDRRNVVQPSHRQSSSSPGESPSSPVSPRAFRSNSLHQPSSATPPLPPPRRKRPESIQVTPTHGSEDESHVTSPGMVVGPSRLLTSNQFRQPSLLGAHPSQDVERHDRERETDGLSIAALQKSFFQLHSKAQPTFDRARYKAEAGLSRRGYIHHQGHLRAGENDWASEEKLMASDEPGMDDGAEEDTDGEWVDAADRGRAPSHFYEHRRGSRDELKFPAGEGWKPL